MSTPALASLPPTLPPRAQSVAHFGSTRPITAIPPRLNPVLIHPGLVLPDLVASHTDPEAAR